jgi:hypothetical protein
MMADFPNLRSIHAGGVLISEEPICCYTALDLPPKGFPTTQFDMYVAEDIGFEKLDILSQRGIGHIYEAAEIVKRNRGISVDVHNVKAFKEDDKVKEQLRNARTIGCFYVESPAMRGLLKKLHCDNYRTLVAASSIIRPGVARSGMMKEYIFRFHNPGKFKYLHPVMEEQLKETFGVMVYQEDVLKICHHFAGLDLADADVIRRAMSGKYRSKKELQRIINKFFENCRRSGYPEEVTKEVWRQIESFAGYSFSKAHSASYAVESYQSLYLKAHYPLEFITGVINNFGGFYSSWVYFNEAKVSGANLHVPCINRSEYKTCIRGKDIFLGFIHVAGLETEAGKMIYDLRFTNFDLQGATADCRLPTADCRLPLPSITPRGRAMVKVPAHPRLAHMIFEAAHAGCAQHACLLAAALTEAAADPTARYETDARRLLDRLEHAARDGFAQRVRELARRWGHAYPAQDRAHLSEGLLLAWAFPDRLGRRRDSAGHYLLRSGRGATLDTSELLAQSEWLVAAELQDDTTDAKIRLAAPLTREEIDDAFGQEYESRSLTSWDKRTESVQAVNRVCLGSIVIKEGGQARPDPADLLAALFEGIRQKGIDQLPWSKSSRALQARICFLHRTLPEQTWPDLSDAELLANLVAWLGPSSDGVTRWSHVQSLDLTGLLLSRLDACGCSRRLLDELAPTHLPVPSGSSIQVRYDQDAPYMEVRIQEVFGMTQTPKIAGGRVPVVMHLLSPAQRPVQVTRDLESFWATGYAYVRKDLRGRYPKHYWPEDPREATPTHRVRPRPS